MLKASIKDFLRLHSQLTQERAYIVERLKQVDAALGSFQAIGSIPATPAKGKKRGRKPGKKVQNEMSLKEAIIKALGKQKMTREQILDGVIKLGYRFRTSNPLNSLNVILYGKQPKFSRKDGLFGVA